MKEVIAVFIYVYPDLISLDLSRNVLKCYGIIMAVMCEYRISNKIYQLLCPTVLCSVGLFCEFHNFLRKLLLFLAFHKKSC